MMENNELILNMHVQDLGDFSKEGYTSLCGRIWRRRRRPNKEWI